MSDDDLNVVITWRPIREEDDWDERRCVYAYANPADLAGTQAIVYVGKADFQSVRERWNDHQVDGLLDELDTDHGVPEPLVLVGAIDVVDGTRLTVELLADIEGLLIRFLEPVGNRVLPRMVRPGLVITNKGRWFADELMATADLDEADFSDEDADLNDEDDESSDDD